ncbi:hypothetical protein LEP1GSC021_3124 [Leptospira noguchii str. 1993005606]|nr:hypothetical protein LEP1GSC021_3124 [Leptospira noguchii str. 1993005606]
MEKFGRLFFIRKTYFLQVKRLILVGTLEKCVFLSLKRFRKKRFAEFGE